MHQQVSKLQKFKIVQSLAFAVQYDHTLWTSWGKINPVLCCDLHFFEGWLQCASHIAKGGKLLLPLNAARCCSMFSLQIAGSS